MLVYVLIIIYTYLASKLFLKVRINKMVRDKRTGLVRKKRSWVMFILSILPAIIVSGIRYNIGPDYLAVYTSMFNSIVNGTYKKLVIQYEVGFEFLNKLIAHFASDAIWMFVITSAIIILLFFYAMYSNSDYYLLSVLILFISGLYFDSFNGIRQYIAIGIFLVSLKYINENNFKKYLFCIAAAATFHTSSIILIPAYFLRKINIRKEYLIGIALIGFVLQNQILNAIYYLMSFITKYNNYLIRDTVANQVSFSASGLLLSVVALIVMLPVEKKIKEKEIGNLYYNMAIIGVAIALMSGFLPFAERLLYYTKNLYVISIPYTLTLYKSAKSRSIFKYAYIGFVAGMNLIGIIFYNWYDAFPYITYFSK